jgi:nucleotide-binding universal stress UspA family protein
MTGIVVGIDGLERSRAALRWAVREAEVRHTSLCVVHAWPTPYRVPGLVVRGAPGEDTADAASVATTEPKLALDLIERELDAVGGDEARIKIERRGAQGDAAKALLEAAEDADLLVVGSRRHDSPARALLGDVVRTCVTNARCPVVVVRDGSGRAAQA